MRIEFQAAGLLLGAALCAQDLGPDTLLLARIRLRMQKNLNRLPDYTCQQTIQRTRKRASSKRYEFQDTVRLEVALVEGKELFAWPGAGKFEDRDIGQMVTGGAIGNGSFALHARSVFLSNAPTFTYVGEEPRNGTPAFRYNFRVPQFRSGYQLKMGMDKAIVGYHGSFWVDQDTLDLIRLEMHADDIPPFLGLSAASDAMEYAVVRIGESEFNLPASSELVMTDLQGSESRNLTRLGNCRQYSGESTLSFGDAPAGEVESPTELTGVEVPGDLVLDVLLESPVNSETSAVGDEITATVRTAVKKGRQVLIPKGAALRGRLTGLEARPGPMTILSVDFQELTFGQSRATVALRLEEIGPLLGFRAPRSAGSPNADYGVVAGRESRSTFFVRGAKVQLPKGTRMVFRTFNK